MLNKTGSCKTSIDKIRRQKPTACEARQANACAIDPRPRLA